MAKDWFVWKGVSCKDYGIAAVELPPITAAEERVKFEEVAGRSGSLAMREGDDVYEDITLSCTCVLYDMANLDAALGWLRGFGQVRFANRPDGWYEGRIVEQIELEKVIAANEARRFALSFRCAPYFYLDGADEIELTGNNQVILNPGLLPSAPRVTLYGSGSVIFDIAGAAIRVRDMQDGIILDTHLQDALELSGAELANHRVSGEFPEIKPGSNLVGWSEDPEEPGGSVTRIVIEPRWRTR